MARKTTGHRKYIWQLGRVIPKIANTPKCNVTLRSWVYLENKDPTCLLRKPIGRGPHLLQEGILDISS